MRRFLDPWRLLVVVTLAGGLSLAGWHYWPSCPPYCGSGDTWPWCCQWGGGVPVRETPAPVCSPTPSPLP